MYCRNVRENIYYIYIYIYHTIVLFPSKNFIKVASMLFVCLSIGEYLTRMPTYTCNDTRLLRFHDYQSYLRRHHNARTLLLMTIRWVCVHVNRRLLCIGTSDVYPWLWVSRRARPGEIFKQHARYQLRTRTMYDAAFTVTDAHERTWRMRKGAEISCGDALP